MDLRICLAGHVQIEVDGAIVGAAGLGSLGRLTLAYLVAERHRPVPTDELAQVLWGGEPPPTWRTALRGLVSKVRALLARAGLVRDEILVSGTGWYQLCLPDGAVVDVEEAASTLVSAVEALQAVRGGAARHAAAALGAARSVIEIASQPFLVGGTGSWLEHRQAELVELRIQALEVLAEAHTVSGDTTAAVSRAEEVIELEPLRESAHVRLMVALASAGNRGAALRAYERCRRLLAEELGVDPSPQTEAAYVDLLGTEPARDGTTGGGSGDGPPVLVALPVPLTSFVGRQTEQDEVRRLLAETRLVTVTGPGGVGKSRLALELAHQMAGEGTEVALVELAPLVEPSRVSARVAEVLGLAEGAGGDLAESLVAHVASRQLLVVLDNCEHLADACAELAHTLLSSCPGVRVLVTSQVRLGVAGETAWVLAPLGVPPVGESRVEDVLTCEAAALFVARARAARPGLALTAAAADALVRLCRRLDGLPLALELAAAHARLLSVEEIAAGLDDRFDLLAGGARTGPIRHQTLRAALEWSHALLTPSQARLLARVSVFAGGFTLEAALAVVSGDDRSGLYPDLVGLVDASLVQADTRLPVTRFGLLETVRHDAAERLEASGEAFELRRRHLAWATSLAERTAPELEGAGQRDGLDRLEAEHANLTAALSWATSPDAPGSALALASALGRFWEIRGRLSEGRRWLRRVLDDDALSPVRAPALAPVRARALVAAAALAQRQGDDLVARSWLEESLVIHRKGGDLAGEAGDLHGLGLLDARAGDVSSARSRYLNSLAIGRQIGVTSVVATSLANLGWLAYNQADVRTASTLLQESLRLYRDERATHGMSWSLYFLGRLAESQGDLDDARHRYEESLALRRELGDRAGLADVLGGLGSVALRRGDLVAARSSHEESLALRREVGDRSGVLESLRHLGDVARLGGALGEARRRYRESLGIAEELDDTCCVTRARLALAKVAQTEHDGGEVRRLLDQAVAGAARPSPDALLAEWLEAVAGVTAQGEEAAASAARLWGAAEGLRAALGIPVPGGERLGHDAGMVWGRQALGHQRWEAAMAEGRALAPETAVAVAQRHLCPTSGG